MTFRRTSTRSFPRRASGGALRRRPAKQWLPLINQAITAGTNASVTSLLAFEAPTITAGTPLTSDPPEDQTILRVIADWEVTVSSSTGLPLWMGLILVDRTWTPIGTTNPGADLDKRWLWMMFYGLSASAAADSTVFSSMQCQTLVTATGVPITQSYDPDHSHLDIAPKVKIEDGKHLAWVVYAPAGAGPSAVTLRNMRILMQRSGR